MALLALLSLLSLLSLLPLLSLLASRSRSSSTHRPRIKAPRTHQRPLILLERIKRTKVLFRQRIGIDARHPRNTWITRITRRTRRLPAWIRPTGQRPRRQLRNPRLKNPLRIIGRNITTSWISSRSTTIITITSRRNIPRSIRTTRGYCVRIIPVLTRTRGITRSIRSGGGGSHTAATAGQ